MTTKQLEILAKKLVSIRIALYALSKPSMNYDNCMRELIIMDNSLRALMRELEREEVQFRMEV